MKTAKQLREQLAKMSDGVAEITAKAKAESRELTADENAEIDKVLGTTGVPGTLAALKDEIARADRIEVEAAERAALESTTVKPVINVKESFGLGKNSFYRTGTLKSFKGPDADKHAYAAGRFTMAYALGHGPSLKWCADHGLHSEYLNTSQAEGSNELGGHLVFPEFERSIIDNREEYGVFRREARVVPMASDTKRIPRRATGLTAYFTGESGSMTESNKTWDAVELVAKKMYVLAKYSNEVGEDAIISMADDLVQEGAYAMAYKEDLCGFLGDGTQTYGGIVGLPNALAAGSITAAAATHTTFGTLTFGDFETVLGRIPTYVRNPKWYISQVGYYASMKRLLDAAGGNNIADLVAGAPLRFLGLPVVISNVLPTALTSTTGTTACYCGDLAMACTLGDRRGITIKRTDDRYFETDEVGIRMTERFDINVHERGDASNAGPIQLLQFA